MKPRDWNRIRAEREAAKCDACAARIAYLEETLDAVRFLNKLQHQLIEELRLDLALALAEADALR